MNTVVLNYSRICSLSDIGLVIVQYMMYYLYCFFVPKFPWGYELRLPRKLPDGALGEPDKLRKHTTTSPFNAYSWIEDVIRKSSIQQGLVGW